MSDKMPTPDRYEIRRLSVYQDTGAHIGGLVSTRRTRQAAEREAEARAHDTSDGTAIVDTARQLAYTGAGEPLHVRSSAYGWAVYTAEQQAADAEAISTAAAALGRRGRAVNSPAQQATSRTNGAHGGRPSSRPRVPCVVCEAGGIRTMTSHRSHWTVEAGERVRCAERPVCRSCEAQTKHYPIAR